MMTNFQQRIAIGTLMAAIVAACMYLSTTPWFQPIFVTVIAALTGIALKEYYQAARSKGLSPMTSLGISANIAFVVATFLSTQHQQWTALPLVVLAVFGCSVFVFFLRRGVNPIENLAVTTFGVVYITLPLSCLVLIAYFSPSHPHYDGATWLLYLLMVTKLTDTAAYFIGKAIGRTRLAPILSPKKTVEGSLAGVAIAIATSLAFYYFGNDGLQLTLVQAICLGTAISLFAQLGDLAESLLKRDANVKDSSQLPGLGGILDTVDSMIFAAPLLYLLLTSGVVGP